MLSLKCYIESFYIDVILKKKNYNTLTVPCETSKMVSLDYSTIKNIKNIFKFLS